MHTKLYTHVCLFLYIFFLFCITTLSILKLIFTVCIIYEQIQKHYS